jgi:hypothetical protein
MTSLSPEAPVQIASTVQRAASPSLDSPIVLVQASRSVRRWLSSILQNCGRRVFLYARHLVRIALRKSVDMPRCNVPSIPCCDAANVGRRGTAATVSV